MKSRSNYKEFLEAVGFRYWTSSLLPALVGTTLPFWLKPPGFTFRFFEAAEFIIATLLCHVGFSFFLRHFHVQSRTNIRKSIKVNNLGYFVLGLILIFATILIGSHLNSSINFMASVYPHIFLVYGCTVIFTGMLYVFPPFSFFRRLGGEVILYFGLGMLPLLGAYLVQVGDLTRTVYIASVPIVVATGLWIWVNEMARRTDDMNAGYKTAVMLFPPDVTKRVLTPFISILIYATLLLAAFVRPSLHPLSLIAFISVGLVYRINIVSWNSFDQTKELQKVESYPMIIHLILCVAIILSSLLT